MNIEDHEKPRSGRSRLALRRGVDRGDGRLLDDRRLRAGRQIAPTHPDHHAHQQTPTGARHELDVDHHRQPIQFPRRDAVGHQTQDDPRSPDAIHPGDGHRKTVGQTTQDADHRVGGLRTPTGRRRQNVGDGRHTNLRNLYRNRDGWDGSVRLARDPGLHMTACHQSQRGGQSDLLRSDLRRLHEASPPPHHQDGEPETHLHYDQNHQTNEPDHVLPGESWQIVGRRTLDGQTTQIQTTHRPTAAHQQEHA
jgi:hypothetical protein